MKDENCCRNPAGATEDRSRVFRRSERRVLDVVKLAIPAALLAFIPKCPLCFAAYFAAATGFGISLTTAGALRWTLIAVGAGAIAYLAVKHLRAAFFSSGRGF